MLYQNGTISIEEILNSLPHKFKNGKNVRIIFEAYLKQYNKIMATYIKAMNGFGLESSEGDQLDKIGNNFSIYRNAMTDSEYREQIKLYWAIYQSSGNIQRISDIFINYFDLNKDIVYIRENGNANIILELNANNTIPNITTKLNNLINATKPLGVGFGILLYASTSFKDTYLGKNIETIIDRYYIPNMDNTKLLDNNRYLYGTFFGNIAIDNYQKEGGRL